MHVHIGEKLADLFLALIIIQGLFPPPQSPLRLSDIIRNIKYEMQKNLCVNQKGILKIKLKKKKL